MRIRYGVPKKLKGQRVVSIGNFDGVHLGHQSLLKFCSDFGVKHQIISSVLTFKPHPRVYFQNISNGCIQTMRDKTTEIKSNNVDELFILPFKKKLANLSAKNFIEDILVDRLGMKAIIVGKDFKFGKGRVGDVEMLMQLGKILKFETHIEDDVLESMKKISSSQLRNMASKGYFKKVKEHRAKILTLSGHVIHGKKIGRTLGFPTLNIVMPNDLCISGIFAVTISGLDTKKSQSFLPAVASLGRRPTVENYGKLILEVYVLNWNSEAYGRLVSVQIHKKIREEIKFDNLDKLRNQMKLDELNVREFFKLNEKR